jgi:hypothetical protein
MDKHNTTTQSSISDSREWCQSKRDTARNSVQRRTHHTKQTLTRIVMDEIEFKQTYDQCVNLINHGPEDGSKTRAQKALNHMLSMIWQLHEDVQEIQLAFEDDDE